MVPRFYKLKIWKIYEPITDDIICILEITFNKFIFYSFIQVFHGGI